MFQYITKIEQKEKTWIKIIEDTAFESVLDGFDMNVYNPHLKSKEVVIQAGGYCGIFPNYFSDEFRLVYTFEPDPLNFFCLTLNCQKENVIKAQAALGENHELVKVHRKLNSNRGMNTVEPNEYGVPTYRIDDLNLPACDFICLDVEGYEYNVLRGGYKTIYKYRPLISVEDTNSKIEHILFAIGYSKCGEIHRDTIYSCPDQQ